MPATDTLSVVRRYAAVWDGGDLSVLDEVCAPNIAVYFPGRPDGIHDIGSLKTIIRSVRRSIPNLRLNIQEELIQGDRVVLRWQSTGTQTGPWNPRIAPTGKTVSWTGISLYRVTGGKIVEERVEEDLLALETQIGVVSPVPAPGA